MNRKIKGLSYVHNLTNTCHFFFLVSSVSSIFMSMALAGGRVDDVVECKLQHSFDPSGAHHGRGGQQRVSNGQQGGGGAARAAGAGGHGHGDVRCDLHKGGLRRGGVTPALAPCMPVMTEDVGKSRPYSATAVLPKGTFSYVRREEIVFE